MTYHVQFLLLVRQPLFDRAALPLTQTSWVLPPLSVGKMTLRLYSALNYSHGLSKGPSFGTGRGSPIAEPVPRRLVSANFDNASRIRPFGSVRVFGHNALKCSVTYYTTKSSPYACNSQ